MKSCNTPSLTRSPLPEMTLDTSWRPCLPDQAGRRAVIKAGLGLAAGALALKPLSALAAPPAMARPNADVAASNLAATPAMTEGPFFPRAARALRATPGAVRNALQLAAQLDPADTTIMGTPVRVSGLVRDTSGTAVAGAQLIVWQANELGSYNHRADPSTAAMSEDFIGWARVVTDPNGAYAFRTILPGSYAASGTWRRPPHIHFHVSGHGYQTLATQMLFEDHPLNAADHLLQSVSPTQRGLLLARLTDQPGDMQRAEFNLTMRAV